jgi:energy-coupling factor transporter ATP-binding protein EcfA2
MANLDPTNEEYLAVVSEWSSYARESPSRVGNAYPLYCLTRKCLVESPLEDFPNPGYIFLVNRGDLLFWDFVRLRPYTNARYKHTNQRECYFIARGAPPLLETLTADCPVALLLDVPTFDPDSASSLIRHPKQNATPVFFVRNGTKIFGPLRRVQVSRRGDETLDSIQWEPAGQDSMVYEFTAEDLKKRGCQFLLYEHPEPDLNEVVHHGINLIAGPVLQVTSERPHDRLSPAQLAEWYLRWRDLPEVPDSLLKTFRTAADYLADTRSDIIRQRCRNLLHQFGTLEVLQAERRNLVRKYLESDDGKSILEQQLALEIERRAQTIEAEVKKRRGELAEEEQRLTTQLQELQARRHQREEALAGELSDLEKRRSHLQEAVVSLEEQLRGGAEQLGAQLRDSIPLLAALSTGRAVVTGSVPPHVNGAPVSPPAPARPLWAEVTVPPPTRELDEVKDEAALVDHVAAVLAAEHLCFTRDFLANLYITLKSSALNLIMGPPGHGKSSVVSALARALGHGNALLEIAVRRSWSDDRYLLGFYDAFHGRYDPGPTGLATRLLQAQRDWEKDRRGIYMLLLDEFNLAAPEYYFSQLLQILTRPPEQRLLQLFDPASLPASAAAAVHQIRLYPNVTFWGTINYDETTERLSPRLLDRTGMIFLTARDVLPSRGAEGSLLTSRKGVSANQLVHQFTRQADQCPENLWELIEPLLDALRQQTEALGPGIDLSPRVIDGVKRYLSNSTGLLPPSKAVDFVVQQRVLPVLRGRGPRFAARIKAVLERLAEKSLDRSAQHVRDALALADANFGDIDFLAY